MLYVILYVLLFSNVPISCYPTRKESNPISTQINEISINNIIIDEYFSGDNVAIDDYSGSGNDYIKLDNIAIDDYSGSGDDYIELDNNTDTGEKNDDGLLLLIVFGVILCGPIIIVILFSACNCCTNTLKNCIDEYKSYYSQLKVYLSNRPNNIIKAKYANFDKTSNKMSKIFYLFITVG